MIKDFSAVEPKAMERFWKKVEKGPADSCWIWSGTKTTRGYGQFSIKGTSIRAHRLAYEATLGPIPDGFDLHHRCINKLCVNPAHMGVIPHQEHVKEANSAGGIHGAKTHCPKGHPYSGGNLIITKQGERLCRKCRSEILKRSRNKAKDAAAMAKLLQEMEQ